LRAGQGLADRASLAATELASNLLRHALPGGWIMARPLPPAAVEILAVDRGPGIADAAAAVAGHSPSPGGLGCGLSAVVNVCARFDIDTGPGRGTAILAVVAAGPVGSAAVAPGPRRWGGVCVGLDEACGDGWAVAEADGATTVAVMDGLGHGAYASAATDAAVAALAEDPADLEGYLARANTAMRGTRGAAIALCRLEPGGGELRFVSVGNIRAGLVDDGGQHTLTASRGSVGVLATPPSAKITHQTWLPGATLVLWTDGLDRYIDLAAAAPLFSHDPAVAAAALYRDHNTDRDDATVVVVRNHARP
jgi:anti-sigma regulatory factor (Ser/Thr protein kinase)